MKLSLASIAFLLAVSCPALALTREEAAAEVHLDPRASDRALSTALTLHTLRAQLELYRIQHKDRGPAMANMNAWQALAGKTKSDGSLSTTYSDLGPYLSTLPRNPFTNSACVVPAGKPSAGAGWTYDEKTFSLRAIIPQESAREAEVLPAGDYELLDPTGLKLATTISAAQYHLVLYMIGHDKHFPSIDNMSNWKAILTPESPAKTPSNHQIAAPARNITSPPINPLTNSSRVLPAGHPAPDAGWTYDDKKGTLRAIIPAKKIATIHELSEAQYELLTDN